MKKRQQAPPWVEVHRVERGLYLSPEGRGGQTATYACVVYEVTEQRGKQHRTRVEDGPPLYERDVPVAGAWFKVLRASMSEVRRECLKVHLNASNRKGKR